MGYELSAYPAPHFWLSVFWVRGIQEIYLIAYGFSDKDFVSCLHGRN